MTGKELESNESHHSIVNDILGTEDVDDLMIEIMDVLGDSIASIPEVGKIYVFVYQPKTLADMSKSIGCSHEYI